MAEVYAVGLEDSAAEIVALKSPIMVHDFAYWARSRTLPRKFAKDKLSRHTNQ